MNSAHHLLTTLGVPDAAFTGGTLRARSPIDGSTTGMVHAATPADVTAAVGRAHAAYLAWRDTFGDASMPPPVVVHGFEA